MTGQHILARLGTGVRLAKGGQFGDRVGIVRWIVEHRCVLEGSVGGEVDERRRAQCHDPTHAVRPCGIEHVHRADRVDGVEVRQILACAAEQRRTVNRRIATLRCTRDVIGFGDVTLDDVNTDSRQGFGIGWSPDECTHGVAALEQLFADVGTRESGAAGDEDDLGHVALLHSSIVTNQTVLVMFVT